MGNPVTNLAELLQSLRPALNEGVCVFASVSPDTDTRSLEPIATFREAEGLTLIVEEDRALKAGLPGEPVYGMTPEVGLPKGWVQRPRSV